MARRAPAPRTSHPPSRLHTLEPPVTVRPSGFECLESQPIGTRPEPEPRARRATDDTAPGKTYECHSKGNRRPAKGGRALAGGDAYSGGRLLEPLLHGPCVDLAKVIAAVEFNDGIEVTDADPDRRSNKSLNTTCDNNSPVPWNPDTLVNPSSESALDLQISRQLFYS